MTTTPTTTTPSAAPETTAQKIVDDIGIALSVAEGVAPLIPGAGPVLELVLAGAKQLLPIAAAAFTGASTPAQAETAAQAALATFVADLGKLRATVTADDAAAIAEAEAPAK